MNNITPEPLALLATDTFGKLFQFAPFPACYNNMFTRWRLDKSEALR